ncbi:histidine phosphotransferase family protein [Roseibacterium sp. SDUM158016]|jgi:histidine phosphotransferase ChpT|uniref:histidine phosphotransferase family protein n=1 Tax=Roseicyclus sediminis TaxID=2980997 RepID=UPI0021D0118E|nr:histidine phosphotransferase family protein [Roseibacterium sp. SDUM158016]MCU4654538.1 histidine phosphotransferase family protein [Roseibacterium sp. SDUM158016]
MDDLTMPETQTLADLIGSRLCHDLSNPLGAIGNGVELLQMTGAGDGPELALIRDAVADALARVRFLRLAFGHAGPDHMTSAREAAAALEGLYRQSRLSPRWLPRNDLPRRQVKLAFLMMLCAETALPMGGSVALSMEAPGHWTLDAQADRIALDEALWSVLRFGAGAAGRPLRPAEAQFMALQDMADRMGVGVNYVREEGWLRLSTA